MGWRDRRRGSPLDRYRAEVVEALRATGVVDRIEVVDDLTLDVSAQAWDGPGRLNLANTLPEWERLDAVGQTELVQRLAQGVVVTQQRPATWDAARHLLVPAVRPWSFVHGDPAGEEIVRSPLVPFLSMLTMIDVGSWTSPVVADDLERWGVQADVVAEAARDRLRGTRIHLVPSDIPGAVEVAGPAPAHTGVLDPDILGSLLPAAQAQLPELAGQVVVLAPTRDRVILVGTDQYEVLGAALEEAGVTYEGSTRSVSPAPYALVAGDLVPWRPPAGHPLHLEVERAHHLLAQVEYDEQQARLQDLLDRADEPLHVMGLLTGLYAEKGFVRSYAVWGPSTEPALLPLADEVGFGDGDESFAVRWDDAVRLAGEWMVPQDLEPPRWRIEGWPPDHVVAQLRSIGHPLGT